METIDYTKFKIEIYSPAGELIKEALTNSNNEFFCQGLVSGQRYYVVFSYDEYFIMSATFNCPVSGKVVYLSPSHFMFNKEIEYSCENFENLVKDKYKFFHHHEQPLMNWQKKIFEILANSGHPVNTSCNIAHKKVVCFKCGNDLAGKVR